MEKQNDQIKVLLYATLGVGILVIFVATFASFFFFFGINTGTSGVDLGKEENVFEAQPPTPETQTPIELEVSKPKETSTSIEAMKVSGMNVFMDRNHAIGGEFKIESTFGAMEGYIFTIKSITGNNLLKLEYDKVLLGSPCSPGFGKGILEIPVTRGIKSCLKSTTCDAGETICFEVEIVNDGVKIKHVIETYDGEA